jgi:hypothetical protein
MIPIQHPLQSVTKADARLLEDALRFYFSDIQQRKVNLGDYERSIKLIEKVDTYYTAHMEPME